MKVSDRISGVFASPIRKLSPYAEAAKAAGKKVYHLNIGQPDIQTPPAFLEAIRAFDDKVIAYGDSRGDTQLLKAVRSYYRDWGMDFDIDEITITSGGSEALLIAMMAVCDPGDEILVFEPFYANYLSFADVLNVNMKAVTTKAENGYALSGEAAVESETSEADASAAAASERVFDFLEEDEMTDESKLKDEISNANATGLIEFDHVKFGYNPDKLIIKDFSAKVRPGQKIAIVVMLMIVKRYILTFYCKEAPAGPSNVLFVSKLYTF